MQFTFTHYQQALELARRSYDFVGSTSGYLALDSAARLRGRVLILRHDCERDLLKAQAMARIEADLSIRSTFFIRAHSEYYSLFQRTSRDIVRNLFALGMEIGLHYEPQFYAADSTDLMTGIRRDIALLQEILGADSSPVQAVSAHQPLLHPVPFERFRDSQLIDMYVHPDIRELTYLSDSGMKWRTFDLSQAVVSVPRCQFLIHPDFWNESEVNWTANLDQLVDRLKRELEETASVEKAIYEDYLRKRPEYDQKFQNQVRTTNK